MRNIKTSIKIALLLFVVHMAHSQSNNEALSETELSVLTCRSGDELYTTFGHTAIRLQNKKQDIDVVYNYGVFSFKTSNFYIKFMRGQLPYYLAKGNMAGFLREYQYYERSVIEQKLTLDNEQKRTLIAFLEDNAKPENREYDYDFFLDNCATRVVDVYALAGDDVTYSNTVEKKTFRDLLKENLTNLPWSEFGIDIVLGARVDATTTRRHQMFLPEYLMKNIAGATLQQATKSQKLAAEPKIILDHEKRNAERKQNATNWPTIIMLILLSFTIAANWFGGRVAKVYNKTLLIVCGLFGLFLVFMWFGTNHKPTRDNWNILWFNPLLLLLVYSKATNWRWLSIALAGFLIVSLLNCFVTFLPQFFHIAFAPIIISIMIAVWSLSHFSANAHMGTRVGNSIS